MHVLMLSKFVVKLSVVYIPSGISESFLLKNQLSLWLSVAFVTSHLDYCNSLLYGKPILYDKITRDCFKSRKRSVNPLEIELSPIQVYRSGTPQPLELRLISNIDCFKRHLKTCLFEKAF